MASTAWAVGNSVRHRGSRGSAQQAFQRNKTCSGVARQPGKYQL